MKTISLLAVALSLAACSAPTTEDVAPRLQELTASTIPGAEPASIVVADAKRSAAKWEWRARVNGREFACDSDNVFRLPSCTAVES